MSDKVNTPPTNSVGSTSSENNSDSTTAKVSTKQKETPRQEAWNRIRGALQKPGIKCDTRQFQSGCKSLMKAILADHAVELKDYNVLILFDDTAIHTTDADKIFKAIKEFSEIKNLLLILFSPGGSIEPAYLISKLCHANSTKFVIAVPRYAKSAATLICCGADELHMGPLSELGPIDPQIRQLPALGLKHAVEHIAELAAKYPEAGPMFAEYLSKSLKLIDLGYYERVVASAEQYAERLLGLRRTKGSVKHSTIAHTLTTEYKDHGFVVDDQEAEKVFGPGFIFRDTPEFRIANDVYTEIQVAKSMLNQINYGFYFTGGVNSEPFIWRRTIDDEA